MATLAKFRTRIDTCEYFQRKFIRFNLRSLKFSDRRTVCIQYTLAELNLNLNFLSCATPKPPAAGSYRFSTLPPTRQSAPLPILFI